MRPNAVVLTLCISVVCAWGAAAQNDSIYPRIQVLETAVSNGSATRDQQIELARLYVQSGRFYEASQTAGRVLAVDPNDADAAAIRMQADNARHSAAQKKVADAEAQANRSGATDQDRLALADAYYDAGSYAAANDLYAKLPAD